MKSVFHYLLSLFFLVNVHLGQFAFHRLLLLRPSGRSLVLIGLLLLLLLALRRLLAIDGPVVGLLLLGRLHLGLGLGHYWVAG